MAKPGPIGPSKYTLDKIAIIANDLLSFAQECLDKKMPMFLERFSFQSSIPVGQFSRWANIEHKEYNEEFSHAYNKFKVIQKSDLAEGCLSGRYHATFGIFTLKNVSDWRDEQYIKGDGLKPVFNIHINSNVKAREGNRLIGHNSKTAAS